MDAGTRYYRPRARPLDRLTPYLSAWTDRIALRAHASFEQPSIEAALFSLAAIAKRRRQRGYQFDA